MPTRRTFDKAEFLPNDNSTPHIVPDVLYPAIGGKLLDGTTSHSGNYGTVQSSDSRKYYYTDIKGSRPIRDPRIGVHFGSQRHIFKSLQFLEQETATHGTNVYSVDGREWIRAVGDIEIQNSSIGHIFNVNDTTTFFEITGYFNQYNWLEYLAQSGSARNRWILSVDGTVTTTESSNQVSADSPLGGRYVNAFSVRNLNTGLTTPRIVTIKMTTNSVADSAWAAGCELIAQDTTNAVTRNKIQIPSQTVFSFGSKFTIGGSSAARHYDPFSAKSDGTGWTSPTSGTNTPNSSAAWPSNIDTATSLGLAKWVDGTNYYRPYNGGRVVNWVDENGEIKTSVNVMPPNAKSIANSGTLTNGTAKTNGSDPNDSFRPTFETHTADVGVDEDLLSEVAKTYRFREFGNGSANAGTNAGSYKDFSMLSGTAGQNNAYVMDDGLTSLSGYTIEINGNGLGDNLGLKNADAYIYFTFIGTGITISDYNGDLRTFAQNLPYGTHVVFQDHDGSNVDWFIDGVQLLEGDGGDTGITVRDITYHQPKMPPIPEGACIIADYMLMADFIPQTSAAENSLSKGVRRQDVSRDIFYDEDDGNAFSFVQDTTYAGGFRVRLDGTADDADSMKLRLPSFSTNFVHRGYASSTRTNLYTGFSAAGSSDTEETSTTSSGTAEGSFQYITTSKTLGLQNFGVNAVSGQNGHTSALEIVTPIHTSHHYKSFETPFLHELIGGDRNMEQTHLICSADGKTWDEVTRDTSYMGSGVLLASNNSNTSGGNSTANIYDEWRGTGYYSAAKKSYYNKDFAIAYDRFICLKSGQYNISAQVYLGNRSQDAAVIAVNGSIATSMYTDRTYNTVHNSTNVNLSRGDYVQILGKSNDNETLNQLTITRI